jgi:hypothetical protein
MSNITTLIENYTAVKKEFQKEATKLLKEEFKNFFNEVPEVKLIKWTQYTPYFNDGDACIFGVNEPTFSNADDASLVNPWGEYEGDEDDAGNVFCFQGTYDLPKELKGKKAQINAMARLICDGAMEDVMLAAFGDHAVVTVTATGIETEEYEDD